MCREVVELQISDLEPLTAEFVKKSQDSKKTVLDFIVNGGASNRHSYEFYKLAGADVELTITESQMDIDEFREQQETYRDGLKGTINNDGTVNLDVNQASMDDYEGEDEEDPMHSVDEEELPFTSAESDDLE
ncbi:hypothetical protein L3i20_v245500 [Paenibacillus sp. L3-i20]|nr:hypothetical protein L3i20_v245500 [Paenibacillus sp. L3-i20]